MTATAFHLLKTILCSGILLCFYWFFLRNKAFHSYNRFYLLFTVILSVCLPFITINFLQEPSSNTSNFVQLLQAVSTNKEPDDIVLPSAGNTILHTEQLLLLIYVCVSIVLLFVFVHSLYKLIILVAKQPIKKIRGISLIDTTDKNAPFSFLQFVFWNSNIDIESPNGQQILQHEIAHVKGKHSYDKLFMNIVLIVYWYNPFFWLIKKELGMIHEFIADKKAVNNNDTSTFASMILQAAYPHHNFQLTNNFFHSPIKRRLTMITKNNKTGYVSRMLALPVLLTVFAAFTFKSEYQQPLYTGKKIVVVIDAGHGGKDAGAVGASSVYEKDLTLAIAKKIKQLNANPDIEIVLSRETDIYQSPPEKADFSNKADANLLVSVHIAAESNTEKNDESGMFVYVSKDEFSNSAESKAFASAMIQTFNQNYSLPVKEMPVQRKKGIWLLQASKCPSVIIEPGFITNKHDLSFLQSEKGQEVIALNVLSGIEKYLTATIKESNTTASGEKTTKSNVDTTDKRALLIINGEKSGSLKAMEQKLNDLDIKINSLEFSANINWLAPAEATNKYGNEASFGAYEITAINYAISGKM